MTKKEIKRRLEHLERVNLTDYPPKIRAFMTKRINILKGRLKGGRNG